MMQSTELQIPIETLRKREKLAELKQELAELFEQREHMINYERPHLLAAYTKLIGEYKYEEFALQITIKRCKRKAELIQTRINRNEPIIIEQIEQQLDAEFAEYERILNEQMESIKAATELLNAPLLSEEEAKELKQLYRLLVKRLHPDWNPNLTQEERDLFVRVQAAYNTANLQELRNILLMIEAKEPITPKEETIDDVITHYEKSVDDLKKRIEELEKTFPFTMREILSNEEEIRKQQDEIKANIAKLQEDKNKWEAYVGVMAMPRSGMGEA